MAKDFLNVIERALMMGISDKINTDVGTGDVYVFGEFPETEELKFPAVIVQMIGSGFEEQFFGQDVTFGSSGASGTGEVYGVQYLVHLICEKDTSLTIGSDVYKQRKLFNWMIDGWRDIGFLENFQWYGATAQFTLYFKNYRT